jgi:hypothetical protein
MRHSRRFLGEELELGCCRNMHHTLVQLNGSFRGHARSYSSLMFLGLGVMLGCNALIGGFLPLFS